VAKGVVAEQPAATEETEKVDTVTPEAPEEAES